ncbi:MAG TPA: coproporphyrinogen III oxidase, partial [Nitrospirae bacterium]|nr:coproporphyrinogen III oxidase [Nitrospirota bacterium]
MSRSLYVHIPFCLKRCIYCDFVSGIYDPQKETAYIKALKQEIVNIPDNVSFETLYIGGGTPTALSTGSLNDLIAHIFEQCKFTIDHEATIEANPGTVDIRKLKAILSSGVN